jgi:hypothetical protein
MKLALGFVAVAIISIAAGSAQAAVKFFSSDKDNGIPGDVLFGNVELADDGLGTVTISGLNSISEANADIPNLDNLFGPGAFFFLELSATSSLAGPHVSNTGGIGGHGPSSTSPGASAEWGVVSGWQVTGFTYCLSSPVDICNENTYSHGSTVPVVLDSNTYDLGTWTFDSVGDYDGGYYITRTFNGGIGNGQSRLRGAFLGASLPALPLIGFAGLAAGLAVVGARAMLGKH